ncbi:hypothetical protein Pint_17410 [Pistacia integerrima]|uniref:Uncharacterized protein n=1 Tax=Pistacia integerrima TaxID=434235 RepID=A0ACC0YX34_9ROSI|nr:hypothetical protein Pint_17410 [Pistacia integerrima]
MDNPKKWVEYLPWDEFYYNSSFHTIIGTTPSKLVYGRDPLSVVPYTLGSSPIEAVDSELIKRDKLLVALKKNLIKAQSRMIGQANKCRCELKFNQGDFVYVKLQPYRQFFVRGGSYSKLSRCFYGPFKVIKRIGKVANRLE